MFYLLLIFFTDTITSAISSLRLHETSCVYNMQFNNFWIVYNNKTVISIKSFFCRRWFLLQKTRALFYI